MTNAEKLAKELIQDINKFADILVGGMCNGTHCDECPLRTINCCATSEIKEWLLKEEGKDEKY